MKIDYITILNSKVHVLTIDRLHEELKRMVVLKERGVVDYLNIYSANLAYEDPWFANFMDSCALVLCDGKGIQLGAWLLGKKVPEQIAYNRWIWSFLDFCEKEKFSLFLLGSKPGVVDKSISLIKEKGYQIKIAGHHGYFDKKNQENQEVKKMINEFGADFLLVGFGMPIQEHWVEENKGDLNSGAILLGGAFMEWMSGDVKLPPEMVTKLGMEWFYRLILEPRRLYKRYLVGIPQFLFRIFFYKFFAKVK